MKSEDKRDDQQERKTKRDKQQEQKTSTRVWSLSSHSAGAERKRSESRAGRPGTESGGHFGSADSSRLSVGPSTSVTFGDAAMSTTVTRNVSRERKAKKMKIRWGKERNTEE
jgi:sRNA-binding protein